MAQKPRIAKGTRDFSPEEVAKRDYIFSTIKKQFKLFGFQPIETPSFELSETLMGKYGDEGDRLIFKILNSGDYLRGVELGDHNASSLTSKISEKALRYDLTVPFARYVVQHQNEITFPFKRYQIQPVWRADRPQKGRFREFFQCDADVVGSSSLWQEVEFVKLYDAVFADLGLNGTIIKINHRKILSGLAEVIDAQDKLIDFTVALDKLDKIGKDKVIEEMLAKGISAESISKIDPIFSITGSFEAQIEALENILANSEVGLEGIAQLRFLNEQLSQFELQSSTLQLELTLARGLNYYTGAIFEVAAPEGVKMGSIGGGGRYDDLTGVFGLKGVGGVGISFGLDRIYLVLEELNLFPETITNSIDILFVNFGDQEAAYAMKAINELRSNNVVAELYPDNAKFKKQFGYADKRSIPYVVIVGEEELTNNTYTLKNMTSGEQENISLDDLINKVKA
ncbi:MAG: histidine--tRNA ligase [bacterium]